MLNYTPNELYVGDLETNINEEILFNAFSRYGKVHSLKVMRHIVTGASRGFAFVNYLNMRDALRAQEAMNGRKFFGKTLRVYLKSDYDNLDPNANVSIQNLPEGITDDEVQKLIQSPPHPFSIRLSKNEKKENESRVHIQFEKMEDAMQLIEKLNETNYSGKKLLVELTNRKNKVFIKARYSENCMDRMKQALNAWKVLEIELPEVSSDKVYFIVLVKLEDEGEAIRLIEDIKKNTGKCEFKRP